MKKNPSTQSLMNGRRGSQHKISLEQKQKQLQKQHLLMNSRSRLPSPMAKSKPIKTQTQTSNIREQKPRVEQKKSDIKQIYEYKIKQRAQKSKQQEKSKEIIFVKTEECEEQEGNVRMQDSMRFMESMRMENEKMSKQLYDLNKENKRLKELLMSMKVGCMSQNNSSSTLLSNQNITSKQVPCNTSIIIKNDKLTQQQQKDYKKQMLSKLNDRQRIRTQLAPQYQNVNNQPYIKTIGGEKKLSKRKQNHSNDMGNGKSNKSKLKESSKCDNDKMIRSGSRNSITMNLNMSFVKIKSPSAAKNFQEANKHDGAGQVVSRIVKSGSRKKLNFTNQDQKNQQHHDQHQHSSVKSLFAEYLQKKSITQQDMEAFYELNKKIFSGFNEVILNSRQVYREMLNKINVTECYDSKRLHDSKKDEGQKNMRNVLQKIQELYKVNSTWYLASHLENSHHNSSDKKYNVSEIQLEIDEQSCTPSSSVVSFTEMHNNPERKKSHEKYRLDKLNENLGLLANFENKKLKTEITSTESTEPKVYLSKPISTNVSRKISFNNSLNNSLKNSKIE